MYEFTQGMKEVKEMYKETDKFLKSIGKHLGNIGANNGAVAEDFFFYGFTATMQVDNIKYDCLKSCFPNLKIMLFTEQ